MSISNYGSGSWLLANLKMIVQMLRRGYTCQKMNMLMFSDVNLLVVSRFTLARQKISALLKEL
jgi:hypothetical protein